MGQARVEYRIMPISLYKSMQQNMNSNCSDLVPKLTHFQHEKKRETKKNFFFWVGSKVSEINKNDGKRYLEIASIYARVLI